MGDKESISTQVYDLVVIGAGGAGMSAALFAIKNNLKVLLIEESKYVGGTTAFSAGTTWIPNTELAETVDCLDDSLLKAKDYLKTVIGDAFNEEMIEVFLRSGNEAIQEIQKGTSVRYKARALHPDYHSDEKGATLYGRALEPYPFDGKLLKKRFSLIRPPIPEFTILSGLMIDRDDIHHLLRMNKSWKSFLHSFKLIGRYAIDRLSHPRGTKLVMGNALIASLLHSLDQYGCPILLETKVIDIDFPEHRDSNLYKVLIQCQGKEQVIDTQNIILATGGINRNKFFRKKQTPQVQKSWCPGMPQHHGSIHNILVKKSVKYGFRKGISDYFWAPVSIRKRKDGTTAVFPHFILDRGKPHMITVNQKGMRFVNESISYHLFGVEMLKQEDLPVYLITDQTGIYRYGLGILRPHSSQKTIDRFVNEGYITKGMSLKDLSDQLNIKESTFEETVKIFNEHAKIGKDPHFNRGSTDYQRVNGDSDPSYTENPNLGPLMIAPFYALKLYPGDIGASTGIQVNLNATVLNIEGKKIIGLYAVGNDMHSIMEGSYPGPGITLGPGLVFSWRAVKNILADRKTSHQR